MNKRLFTSESVTESHPDKTSDAISDALLDAFIKEDKYSRVAIETLVTTGLVLVAGEVTSKGYVDIQGVVRNTVRELGYTKPEYEFDYKSCGVLVAIHEQSPDIAQGVLQGKDPDENLGSGDQGSVFSYACNETPELMPLPITLAHALTKKYSELRKSGKLTWARPDGKSQVTVEYQDGKPVRIDTVVMSVQHDDIPIEKVRMEVMEYVIKPVLGVLIDTKTKFHINPTGRFVLGGPSGDTGLTGRKIIVDTYGGMGRHGGGAFCLAGDSLVNSELGMIRIDESQEVGSNGLLVKTDVHPMPAAEWYDNGLKETFVLETSDGYSIEGTPNHLVRVLDSEGNYVWKSIENLTSGDNIAIQTKNRLFGDDSIPKFDYTYREGTVESRKKKYFIPTKLNEDLGYLLGLLIGDGDCTDEGCIKIGVCEKDAFNSVRKTYKNLFGSEGKVYGHWAYLGGVELRAFLKHLGLGYEKSYDKKVPKMLWKGSKRTIAGFLRGLFDTDGGVSFTGRNNNSIRLAYVSTSKQLAKEVQLLLLNFGIVSVIQIHDMTGRQSKIRGRIVTSRRPSYVVVIKGDRSKKLFAEEIGFSYNRKQRTLEEKINLIKRDLLVIPNQKDRINRLYKKLPQDLQLLDACKVRRFTRSSRGKATKQLTYEKLSEFISCYDPFLKNDEDYLYLKNLYFMNHFYTRLTRKIPSFARVYDLNIPVTHTFTANGFVVHNSGKDPTKVDRSGAYAARYVAKNLVAAGVAPRIEVQLSYAIGVKEPVSIYVDCFGESKFSTETLEKLVMKIFPLSPAAIIKHFDLRRPIYFKTASFGHFGRSEFPWEKTDKVQAIKKELGLK